MSDLGGIISGMQVAVGDWWTMDDRGRGSAHRVAAVIPDLVDRNEFVNYDYSQWIPLCACDPVADAPRTASATMFSTFAPGTDRPRCSRCEVMSPALDRWLTRTEAAR
ncbi:hypothetical protein [Mycolicibacterium fortuitum]|uniref:hypothetical protein n=1 Tax=Mycolicibacterium fortuitum TaxID=1766 RepID=UPI003AAF2B18